MLKLERSFISVAARRFRSRAIVELENLSVSMAPDVALNEKGRALSSPAPLPTSWPNYFLTFAFLARAADP